MKNSIAATLLIIVFLSNGLMAGDAKIVLPDSTLYSPGTVIYIENKSRHAAVKLPPRPIAQTVIGIILSSDALISAGFGTYYFIEADRARKDTTMGDFSSSIEAALDDVVATVYMIAAGCTAIPGTILLVAAKKRWDKFNRAQASLGFRYDPRRDAIRAVARIDF